MYLYGFDSNGDVVKTPVIKETPEGYKVHPIPITGGRRFIRKSDVGFPFPEETMAIDYMRDIHKAAVCYAFEDVKKAEELLEKRKRELVEFDGKFKVEDATDQATVNMHDYRVHIILGIVLVRPLAELRKHGRDGDYKEAPETT